MVANNLTQILHTSIFAVLQYAYNKEIILCTYAVLHWCTTSTYGASQKR